MPRRLAEPDLCVRCKGLPAELVSKYGLRTHLKWVDDSAPNRPVRIMAMSQKTIQRVSPSGSAAMSSRSSSSSGVVMNQSVFRVGPRQILVEVRPYQQRHGQPQPIMQRRLRLQGDFACHPTQNLPHAPTHDLQRRESYENGGPAHQCSARSIWPGPCSERW